MLILPSAVERGSIDRALPPATFHLVVFLLAEQQYALPLPMVERVLPMVAVSPSAEIGVTHEKKLSAMVASKARPSERCI